MIRPTPSHPHLQPLRLTVWLLLMAGAMACRDPHDEPFGRLPRLVEQSLAATTQPEGSPLSDEEQERLYRQLRPHFAPLREREVPFTDACDDGYTVRQVRVERLRNNCNLELSVELAGKEDAPQGTQRLHVVSLDREGNAFDRSLLVAEPGRTGDNRWHGCLCLHLTAAPEGYERFGELKFVSDEEFDATAEEIRRYRSAASAWRP